MTDTTYSPTAPAYDSASLTPSARPPSSGSQRTSLIASAVVDSVDTQQSNSSPSSLQQTATARAAQLNVETVATLGSLSVQIPIPDIVQKLQRLHELTDLFSTTSSDFWSDLSIGIREMAQLVTRAGSFQQAREYLEVALGDTSSLDATLPLTAHVLLKRFGSFDVAHRELLRTSLVIRHQHKKIEQLESSVHALQTENDALSSSAVATAFQVDQLRVENAQLKGRAADSDTLKMLRLDKRALERRLEEFDRALAAAREKCQALHQRVENERANRRKMERRLNRLVDHFRSTSDSEGPAAGDSAPDSPSGSGACSREPDSEEEGEIRSTVEASKHSKEPSKKRLRRTPSSIASGRSASMVTSAKSIASRSAQVSTVPSSASQNSASADLAPVVDLTASRTPSRQTPNSSTSLSRKPRSQTAETAGTSASPVEPSPFRFGSSYSTQKGLRHVTRSQPLLPFRLPSLPVVPRRDQSPTARVECLYSEFNMVITLQPPNGVLARTLYADPALQVDDLLQPTGKMSDIRAAHPSKWVPSETRKIELTWFTVDLPAIDKVDQASVQCLTYKGYQQLLDSAPWDNFLSGIARCSRTFSVFHQSAVVVDWLQRWFALTWTHRQAVWERLHWLPLTQASKAASAELESVLEQESQLKRQIKRTPSAQLSDELNDLAERSRQCRFWVNECHRRKQSNDRYKAAVRVLATELHTQLCDQVSRCFLFDPSLPPSLPEPLIWNPRSEDLVADLKQLDTEEPVRLGWAEHPNLHPFFRHELAKWHRNIYPLHPELFPTGWLKLLERTAPSPMALLSAMPNVKAINAAGVDEAIQEATGYWEHAPDESEIPRAF